MTPDPRKPYKAWAAAIVTLVGMLWANLQGVEDWSTLGFQDWASIVVPTLLSFAATYFVSNPDDPRAAWGIPGSDSKPLRQDAPPEDLGRH